MLQPPVILIGDVQCHHPGALCRQPAACGGARDAAAGGVFDVAGRSDEVAEAMVVGVPWAGRRDHAAIIWVAAGGTNGNRTSGTPVAFWLAVAIIRAENCRLLWQTAPLAGQGVRLGCGRHAPSPRDQIDPPTERDEVPRRGGDLPGVRPAVVRRGGRQLPQVMYRVAPGRAASGGRFSRPGAWPGWSHPGRSNCPCSAPERPCPSRRSGPTGGREHPAAPRRDDLRGLPAVAAG